VNTIVCRYLWNGNRNTYVTNFKLKYKPPIEVSLGISGVSSSSNTITTTTQSSGASNNVILISDNNITNIQNINMMIQQQSQHASSNVSGPSSSAMMSRASLQLQSSANLLLNNTTNNSLNNSNIIDGGIPNPQSSLLQQVQHGSILSLASSSMMQNLGTQGSGLNPSNTINISNSDYSRPTSSRFPRPKSNNNNVELNGNNFEPFMSPSKMWRTRTVPNEMKSIQSNGEYFLLFILY
jgi:hypothetical protein